MPFFCSICEEESTRICVNCTKDTCGNHLCDKCGSCSDCCDCEVTLENRDNLRAVPVREAYPHHDNHREGTFAVDFDGVRNGHGPAGTSGGEQ